MDTGPISSNDYQASSEQLANLVALLAKQDQISWTIYGLFWPANALLLVALFTTGDLPTQVVGIVVSVVGVVLSMVWTVIQFRAIAHLDYYEAIIDRIEEQYVHVPTDIAISGRLNADLFRSKVAGTLRVRPLIKASPIVAAVLWILSASWFALLCGAG